MIVGVIPELCHKKVYDIPLQRLLLRNQDQTFGTGLFLKKVVEEQGWVTWFW